MSKLQKKYINRKVKKKKEQARTGRIQARTAPHDINFDIITSTAATTTSFYLPLSSSFQNSAPPLSISNHVNDVNGIPKRKKP